MWEEYSIRQKIYVVDGQELTRHEYMEHMKIQNPHMLYDYWLLAHQKFRYGPDLTAKQAKCYADRYSDVKKEDGASNNDAIKEHWI